MASAAVAVEANLFAFFQQLSLWPRVELHDDRDCFWTISDLPFPLFNSVMRSRVEDDRADALIEARVTECRRRHVPMLWWTGPASRPSDLRSRLDRHGFLLEPAFGMAADLRADAPVSRGDDPASEVEPVDSISTMQQWSRVLCESFGAPQRFGHAFTDLAAAIGLGARSPFRHFLARVDGQPAATCSLFLGAGVAGIYDVATLPELRRRGVATVVTRAAMREAGAAGCRLAILHSSTSAVGIYRSLGFREVCSIGQHVWSPAGPGL